MADDIESVAAAFQAEMNPGTSALRNDRGQFQATREPEHFDIQDMEGEDASSGDDDDTSQPSRREVPNPKEDDLTEEEREAAKKVADDDGDEENQEEEDDDEEHDVIVDGQPAKVKLKEALAGYIRTETFHKRMNKVSEAAQIVTAEARKVADARDQWIQRMQQLEAEYNAVIPKEPDWDVEFARDPKSAHELKKQFDVIKGKIASLRDSTAKEIEARNKETSETTNRAIKIEHEKFVADEKLSDPKVFEREVMAMRKTALSIGFTEEELNTVYDSRMLKILRKASRYDRLMAAKPKAAKIDTNRTLASGSGDAVARRSGGTGRKEVDAALLRQQKSGSIEDTAEYFRRAFV